MCLWICSFVLNRFERLKAKDADFERRFANLGNINFKQGVTEFNWDSNIDEHETVSGSAAIVAGAAASTDH